jgi:outer membrane immunogenic protein
MKQLLGGIALSLILAAPALAADMRLPVKAPPAMAATLYNWTGFYSATGLGVSWWDINGSYADGSGFNHNTSASRFNYSSMVGAQYQAGNWVLGIEGAFNNLFGRGYASSNSPSADCLGATTDRTCSSRVSNIWTVGGRLGYAWDRFMAFGGGGYANGRIQTRTNITSTGALTSESSDRHGGWYAGGGVEMYVTRIWTSDVIFGVEYQHIDLRGERHATSLAGVATPLNDRNMDATIDTVRARLIFKWTPGGPVMARY